MSKLKKMWIYTIIGGVLAAAVVGAPAQASERPGLSPAFVTEVTTFWSTNSVSKSTQKKLLATLESGHQVDAQKAEAIPVSIQQVQASGGIKEIERFADGSVNTLELEQPSGASGDQSTQRVFNCQVEATPMIYRRCTVTGTFTAVTLGFLADYQLSNSSRASILRYDSPSVRCIGFTCSTPTFELIRQVQSGSTAAQVNLVTTYNLVGTGTTRLALFVRGLSATTN